jgi:hypothetical protein
MLGGGCFGGQWVVCASEGRTIYIQPPGARPGARGVLPSGESGELLIMAFELLL